MISTRCAMVTVRAHDLRRRGRRRNDPRERRQRRAQEFHGQRRHPSGPGPRPPAAAAMDGSRWNRRRERRRRPRAAAPHRGARGRPADGRGARLPGRATSSRLAASEDRRPWQHRPTLDQDQLARDRDEGRYVAEALGGQRSERLEIRAGERSERHRQHVEPPRLDKRQQEPERAVEVGHAHVRRAVRAARVLDADLEHGQFASSASAEQFAVTRVAAAPPGGGSGSPSIGLQPAAAARDADVSAWSRSRSSAARSPGSDRRDAPDPCPVVLAQRPRDARPDARLALARVMEQPRDEHVGLGHALCAQARDDVQAVTLIGDVHRVEEAHAAGASSRSRGRAVPRPHRRAQMRPELAGPTAPPGN